MSFKLSKDGMLRCVSVILRVPALFLAEAWYRTDPKVVHYHLYTESKGPPAFVSIEKKHQEMLVHTVYYSAILLAVSLMMLPLKKLVNFYMYAVSAGLFGLAHYLSSIYVEAEKTFYIDKNSVLLEDAEGIQRIGIHLAAQCVISATIIYLINLQQWTKFTLLIYATPMLGRIVGISVVKLHLVHNFASIFSVLMVVMFIFNHLPLVLDLFKTGFNKMTMAVQMYGWIPFIVAMWFKILLPVQFLVFWLVLFGVQLFKYLSVPSHPIFGEGWLVVVLASIGECCVTPISLMGICITVSYVAHIILTVTKFYLQGRDAFANDNVMHRGWTEGFTMFLLSIQTGLIELKAPQRAFLMSIVLFIVFSSLIQSIYEITDPILLSLGASQSKAIFKHVRAILLCTILWMFPLYMTYAICQFFDLDFWLLVVVSSCVLTSVQVLGSLAVYTLFMYDAVRQNPWENLDDVVYYAKATTRVLEFVVAVFVVCYGVRESLFGDWSWVNSSILLIHCYFNVWQRLQAGWKSYLMRREAVKKIESLPLASQAQLRSLEDVCAICFQELQTARITACRHFFHGVCLRKWLYVQENCPMCHQKISYSSEENAQNVQNGQHVENLQQNANNNEQRHDRDELLQQNVVEEALAGQTASNKVYKTAMENSGSDNESIDHGTNTGTPENSGSSHDSAAGMSCGSCQTSQGTNTESSEILTNIHGASEVGMACNYDSSTNKSPQETSSLEQVKSNDSNVTHAQTEANQETENDNGTNTKKDNHTARFLVP